MAQTFTAAVMGNAANDGSGNKLRAGGLKIATDLAELYAAIQALQSGTITVSSFVRSQKEVTATGAANQVIPFTSQFVIGYTLYIIDTLGLGIDVVAQDEDGFTITPVTGGNFGYVAIIEE